MIHDHITIGKQRELLLQLREIREQRKRWYDSLVIPNKEEYLFTLDTAIKGFFSIFNKENLPGEEKKTVSDSLKGEVIRYLIKRIVERSGELLGYEKLPLEMQDSLEESLEDDELRIHIVSESTKGGTPSQSLYLLYSFFHTLNELIVSPQLLNPSSILKLIQRELVRNRFFCPVYKANIVYEYDSMLLPELIDIGNALPYNILRQICYLYFILLNRFVKYIDDIEGHLAKKDWIWCYVVLSVLRSETRLLYNFIYHELSILLIEDLNHLFFSISAQKLSSKEVEFKLLSLVNKYQGFVKAVYSITKRLELEITTIFRKRLPPFSQELSVEMRLRTIRQILPELKNVVFKIAQLLIHIIEPEKSKLIEVKLHIQSLIDFEFQRENSWIFSIILRAFIKKLKVHFETLDKWETPEFGEFIDDFLNYFWSIGYITLLLNNQYENEEKLLDTLSILNRKSGFSTFNINYILGQLEEFEVFLNKTFKNLSATEELKNKPFNKHKVALILKGYLRKV